MLSEALSDDSVCLRAEEEVRASELEETTRELLDGEDGSSTSLDLTSSSSSVAE